MNRFSVYFVAVMCVASMAHGAVEAKGKYNPGQYNRGGKYVATNDGTYNGDSRGRYVHQHDNRERGHYTHIPVPYDGGYGPYDHIPNPYEHVTDSRYDPTGEYSFDKYLASGGAFDPFAVNVFDIPKPDVYLEYGTPFLPRADQTKNGAGGGGDDDSDRGKKYRILYETNREDGTQGSGYYSYPGDDGKIRRIEYEAADGGFYAKGDQTKAPLTFPPAIQRSLAYVSNIRRKRASLV